MNSSDAGDALSIVANGLSVEASALSESKDRRHG